MSNEKTNAKIRRDGKWPDTTPTLLDGLWRGERADWNKFWQRYEKPIETFVKWKLYEYNCPTADRFVEDSVHNAMLRIQKQVAKYDISRGKFRTFLCTVIQRNLINEIIKEGTEAVRTTPIDRPVGGEGDGKSGETLVDKIPAPDPEPTGVENETALWNLAVAVEVLTYVVKRFQWSAKERQIIEQLLENYHKSKKDKNEDKDQDAYMERGIIKAIAANLGCSESLVSTTRKKLHSHFDRLQKRYKDEDLMLQGKSIVDKSLRDAIVFRYSRCRAKVI